MKLSEIAYHDFKKALLSRKIVPGDTMTQASLAKILKTQISPLRIAMHRLETEGLVKILPRSGIHIVKPDLSVIRDSYHLRKIIETEAIKTYARYATDSAIDGLISKNDLVLEKLRKSGISPEVLREADKIDKLMHRDFIDALSNPLIAQVYETNNDKIGVVRLDQPNALSPVILEEIVIEHLKILTAIKERDPDKAGKALVDPAWPGTSLTGMGILDRTNGPNRESLSKSGPGRSAYEMLDVATTSAAIEELDAYAMRREQGEDKPFAMTVGFMLPHAPYVASAEDFERFRGKIPPTIVPRPAAKDEHPWIREWRQLRQIEEVSESAIERARTAYYGLTYRLDYNIGKILDHLEAKNLADNTLIIYTSDHGDHVGERGLWWKHTFYEDSVRVPLILSMPGTLPENERRSAIVSLIDVCATMLDATNSDPLPNSDGRSFWDAARDGDLPFNGTAFSEYCTTDAQDFGGAYKQQRMVRKGNWKLNFYSGYQPELYDLLNDPNELNDLSSSSAHDDVKNELLDLVLKDWDAERVEEIMRRQTQNHSLLRKWAEQTQPADAIRWQYDKNVNFLEG